MNEQTTKLIEQLAQKLGTTSEYLWGILLKQAKLDAINTLTQCVLIWIGAFFLYKLHKFLCKKDNLGKDLYWKHEEAIIIPMMALTLIEMIMLLISFFSLDDIVTGYFNPEYWALDRILEQLK